MFKTLAKKWGTDPDLPARATRIIMLRHVLDGTLYDILKHPFSQERTDNSTGSGDYIPMRERRPSVRQNLCRTVVNDSTSLLFSEGNFPSVQCKNEETKIALARMVKELQLNMIMIEAAKCGAVGSVAVLLRALEGRIFLDVMNTEYLMPFYDPKQPDKLIGVVEMRKVTGKELSIAGYAINDDDLGAQFWYKREWTEDSEIWYQPLKYSDWKELIAKKNAPDPFKVDEERTTQHDLDFCPIVWIKNLPGGDDVDGCPTLVDEAIDTQIEIDYQLSQAGRALKFMGDPTLVITGDEVQYSGQMVKGAANAIQLPTDAEAKLLEINGESTKAVIDYVQHLREIALESMHGNRATPEKMSAAQSGRALELLNQSLVWLTDKLRITYGLNGFLAIIQMIIRISEKVEIIFKDETPIGKLNAEELALRWPPFFAPTLLDKQNLATTLHTLCNSGLLSRQKAIEILADYFSIENAEAEKLAADADMAERNENAQIQAKIPE